MNRFRTPFHSCVIAATLMLGATVLSAQQATSVRATSLPRSSQSVVSRTTLHPAKPLPAVGTEETRAAVEHPLTTRRTPKVVDAVQAALPGVEAGFTYYDFQTNGAMANRVVYTADGPDKFVQMVWMTSKDSTRDLTTRIPGFTGNFRGTHYTFADVTNPDAPVLGIEDWQKVEAQRAGWPSLVQYADGLVGTPSHTPIRFYGNSGLGDQPILYKEVTSPADSALWPRAAVDGNGTTHLIYNRTLGGAANQANVVGYRRSTDGGFTWSSEVVLNGSSSPAGQLNGGLGGDTYAVTARGNKVVVAWTEYGWRTLSYTSTDGGETWPAENARVIYGPDHTDLDSGMTEWGTFKVYTDTVPAPNGHLDVIIDSEGTTHYVIGTVLSTIVRSDTLGQRQNIISFLQDRQSLRGSRMLYTNQNEQNLFFMAPPNGGDYDGNGVPLNLRYLDGMSRWPQLGVDKQDNIYMTYGSFKNGDVKSILADTTGGNQQTEPDTLVTVDALNGHIYATYKPKGFNIWSTPTDLTPEGVNCQYASLCDEVENGRMYIGYSASPNPGDRVTNVETPADPAKVMLMAFDISKLSPVNSVEESEPVLTRAFITPNPATDMATVRIVPVTEGRVTVSLVSTLGETIMTSQSPAGIGSWDLMIATRDLTAGTYHVVVEQNGVRTVSPLVVVR